MNTVKIELTAKQASLVAKAVNLMLGELTHKQLRTDAPDLFLIQEAAIAELWIVVGKITDAVGEF